MRDPDFIGLRPEDDALGRIDDYFDQPSLEIWQGENDMEPEPAPATIASSAISAETLQHLLGTGDLSKLTTSQRVELYLSICKDLKLNAKTRPFRFLLLNNQIQMYATKECTDQLRALHAISLQIKEQKVEGDIYVVTASATTRDRRDEDIGAVAMPRQPQDGLSRANATMKAVTKAKRRVTLSICGLGGMLDESELDSVGPVKTFDADEDLPSPDQPLKIASDNPALLATKQQRKTFWAAALKHFNGNAAEREKWYKAQCQRFIPAITNQNELTTEHLRLLEQELVAAPPEAGTVDEGEDIDF